MSLRAALYLRVSRADQNCEMQDREASELVRNRSWSITHKLIDHGQSGAKSDRAALRQLLDAARRGEFDVLVVWRLDRLGRTLSGLVATLDELRELGIGFVSVRDPFDTTTASGRAFLQIAAVFAELERELMRERTRGGIETARQRGVPLGRPRASFDVERARAMHAQKFSSRRIADELGVSQNSVLRALRAAT